MQTHAVRLDRSLLSENCGCQSKLSGHALTCLLSEAFASGAAPEPEDCAALTVGGQALLVSLDFGPPVTGDLHRAGSISAHHALSDLWAMGGTPVAATAIMILDPTHPPSAGASLLAGMAAACAQAGVAISGGHTVVGQEAIVGLSVIGTAGSRTLSKRGARAGDHLLISKPVGVGMTLRAHRYGLLGDDELEPTLVSMETSNAAAATAAIAAGVNAATDVTGYGLIGHAAEMLAAAGLGARLQLSEIPVLDAARTLPETYSRSTWIEDNLDYAREQLRVTTVLDRRALAPLLDPQTSGGLLVASPPSGVASLREAGFRDIGIVTGGDTPVLEVEA